MNLPVGKGTLAIIIEDIQIVEDCVVRGVGVGVGYAGTAAITMDAINMMSAVLGEDFSITDVYFHLGLAVGVIHAEHSCSIQTFLAPTYQIP